MMIRKLIGSTLFVFTSCATVPENAPAPLHQAQSAIKEMESTDANRAMPNTAKRANADLKESVKLYESSLTNKNPEIGAESIRKAEQARAGADGVLRVHRAHQEWDQSPAALAAGIERLNLDTTRTAALAAVPRSPFAKLHGTEIVSTIGYFTTDSTALLDQKNDELRALANVLKQGDEFKVQLIGHADTRGTKEYNQALALRRAESTAKVLENMGVDKKRIATLSRGADDSKGNAKEPTSMQFDRRVQAKITME
jgi:outer membrane protein OmpA-like peptidoglycan-associated protein